MAMAMAMGDGRRERGEGMAMGDGGNSRVHLEHALEHDLQVLPPIVHNGRHHAHELVHLAVVRGLGHLQLLFVSEELLLERVGLFLALLLMGQHQARACFV